MLRAMTEEEGDTYQTGLARVQEAAAVRIAAEVDPVTPPVGVADFVDHIDYLVGFIVEKMFAGPQGLWV